MTRKKNRVRPTRHRSILDFLGGSTQKKDTGSAESKSKENKAETTAIPVADSAKKYSRNNDYAEQDRRMEIAVEIDEMLRFLDKKKNAEENTEKHGESSKASTTVKSLEEIVFSAPSIVDVELEPLKMPTGEILDEIFRKGLNTGDVVCYNDGRCSDGISIGETYTDSYGFTRQRGYVNTTRLPVYTDWILEDAIVKKILPKAYGLKTNRGAVALIPEDFLCELEKRYGIRLLNYDKCKNYKTIMSWQSKSARPKRRKKR